jgi:hypothetical protein
MSVRQLAAGELDTLLELYLRLHTADDLMPARAQVEAAWKALLENPALSAHAWTAG